MKRIRLSDPEPELELQPKPKRVRLSEAPVVNHSQLKAQFISAFRKIAPNRDRYEVFRDFLELAYCAIAKPTMGSTKAADEIEARYMSIVNRSNKDDIRAMPELLGICGIALKDGGCDFLGSIVQELELLSKDRGQFFTPYELSRTMAELTLEKVGEVISQNGFVTISEPACGAAGMMIAAADVIARQGFDIGTQMYAEVVDVSENCFYMAYLQLSLRGVPARVVRGNTLSLEVFETARTPAWFGFAITNGDPWKKKSARIRLNEGE